MSGGATVVVIVAPNGLGHARRALGVLSRLVVQKPRARSIDVAIEPWQRTRLSPWRAIEVLERYDVVWHAGITAPGVSWTSVPSTYADGRLMAWEDRLASLAVLRDADLVVSDNLVGVLAHRPDAVLMGSFLWSDVLEEAYPSDPGVQEFVRHERTLLDTHRPLMICVGDLVMRGVLERTAAREVGWMCQGETPWASDDAGCIADLLERRVEIRETMMGLDRNGLDQAAAILAARLHDARGGS